MVFIVAFLGGFRHFSTWKIRGRPAGTCGPTHRGSVCAGHALELAVAKAALGTLADDDVPEEPGGQSHHWEGPPCHRAREGAGRLQAGIP